MVTMVTRKSKLLTFSFCAYNSRNTYAQNDLTKQFRETTPSQIEQMNIPASIPLPSPTHSRSSDSCDSDQ